MVLGATLSITLGKKNLHFAPLCIDLSQGPGGRPGTSEDQVYPGQPSYQSQTFKLLILVYRLYCVYRLSLTI